MNFDWKDLAFGSKKSVNGLRGIFIAAPRDISAERFKQLVKEYLPKGNIILGLSKEHYVEGFEEQPQFLMLQEKKIRHLIDLINDSNKIKNKVYTLDYFQRELPFLIQKLNFSEVVLVRGSWRYAFHTLPSYYALIEKKVPYVFVSPFVDEKEARDYEGRIGLEHVNWLAQYMSDTYTEAGMLDLATKSARLSYDYSFQTGVVVGKRTNADPKRYNLLLGGFNKVVPYQTYAMHYGNSREEHFAPPNDLNYYDTVHAEVELILWAHKKKLGLKGTTLFINLMPCPTCSRMLGQTEVEEVVYSIDHSDGYAIKMLEASGKKVRRVVA